MEIEAEELVQLLDSGKLTKANYKKYSDLRLRKITDLRQARKIAHSELASHIKRIDLTDGEINSECATILLLKPPCLDPEIVDMQSWPVVLALTDLVRLQLMDRYGERLKVTNQYWGR
jgi:hypothetical protein